MKMILFFLAVISASLTNACSDHTISETPKPMGSNDTIPQTDTNSISTDTLHYLALGDSYTIGESVKYEERYPVQLVQQLRQKGFTIAEPTIIARTGWTTTQLKTAIQQAKLEKEYDLVSLLIGVNNQYQGMKIDFYKTEFQELLKKAIELAGGDNRRVFVISIPDYAYTPFGRNSTSISKEIDAYNAINLSITAYYGITYFDITPISRKGLEQPNLIATDDLHPSGIMYAQWVDLMFPTVLAKLQ